MLEGHRLLELGLAFQSSGLALLSPVLGFGSCGMCREKARGLQVRRLMDMQEEAVICVLAECMSGDAIVYGKSVQQEMHQIRQILGAACLKGACTENPRGLATWGLV